MSLSKRMVTRVRSAEPTTPLSSLTEQATPYQGQQNHHGPVQILESFELFSFGMDCALHG